MSPLCMVLSGLLGSLCVPPPPAVLDGLSAAVELRPAVERAVSTANALLSAAGEGMRLVPAWTLDRAAGSEEIVVYLMKSPAPPAGQAAQRERAAVLVEKMQSDLSEIDETLDACTDRDDCVENLYPEETGTIALTALNQLNGWEVGRTDPACRCILLIENELRIFRQVFGANWGPYIISTRYDSVEEIREALAAGRIPELLLDEETLSLPAMISFILLHETGHRGDGEARAADALDVPGLKAYVDSLDPARREEVRADGFAASVLARACFGRGVSDAEKEVCLAAPELGLLTFVIGVKGKSKAARCLRYLDTVQGYPNWQARFLIVSALYADSESISGLLADYLATRASIAAQPWARSTPACAAAFAQSSRRTRSNRLRLIDALQTRQRRTLSRARDSRQAIVKIDEF